MVNWRFVNMLKDFEKLVDKSEYNSFLNMLKTIGPESRTHRISVFIAGFLRYAFTKIGSDPTDDGIEAALVKLDDDVYHEGEKRDMVLQLIGELCEEAGIKNERVSAEEVEYSIAENALDEYSRWYNMKWENF